MDKLVIVINGSGGVGKDTICEFAGQIYKVWNISSITPILDIAKSAGWNGEKTPEARRLLSQLKEVFTQYNDLSFTYCMKKYKNFLQSDAQILFVHIREAEEIARFRDAVGAQCKTLLVRRASVEARGRLGNRSDDAVYDFTYDYVLNNDGTYEALREQVAGLLAQVMK